jgi:hypothetical protein
MKNNHYVIRAFRNGRSGSGYSYGKANRFATAAEAEANAAKFAADVLPTSPADYIAVGLGAVRDGLSVGAGYRLAEYYVRGRELRGDIVRRDCRA